MSDQVQNKRGRPSSSRKILEAAHEIVMEQGAGRLTYEALAQRTGLSKGGLMHNFPTKVALLEAMIGHYVGKRQASRAEKLKNLAGNPKAEIISLIETRLDEAMKPSPNAASVLAAAAENPELLRPIRQALKDEAEEVWKKDNSPAQSYLALLALEGLCFQEIFGISPLTNNQKKLITETILTVAREGS